MRHVLQRIWSKVYQHSETGDLSWLDKKDREAFAASDRKHEETTRGPQELCTGAEAPGGLSVTGRASTRAPLTPGAQT